MNASYIVLMFIIITVIITIIILNLGPFTQISRAGPADILDLGDWVVHSAFREEEQVCRSTWRYQFRLTRRHIAYLGEAVEKVITGRAECSGRHLWIKERREKWKTSVSPWKTPPMAWSDRNFLPLLLEQKFHSGAVLQCRTQQKIIN